VNPRKRLWIPIWLAPRTYWAIAVIALLCAAGAAVAPFWWIAIVLALAFVVAFGMDIAWGPTSAQLRVERIIEEQFSLRRAGTISYLIRYTGEHAVHVGILEAPCGLLRFEPEEVRTTVAARKDALLERPVVPRMRGTDWLTTLFITIENPIGLLRRRLRVPLRSEVRVHPDLSSIERYGKLHARNRLVDSGLRRMRLRGVGTEPESVREWSSGDPFRAIDWKATARRGSVMVTQYEVERSQNVMIVLDAGRLMMPVVDEQRKFDYAVTAALSVAGIASLASDKIGLIAFAGEILRAFAPRPGGRSPARIAQAIRDLQPRFEESDYERVFSYIRTHIKKRSLVIIFTDMLDPVAQSSVLAQIGTMSRRHLVVCAFMNDSAIDKALQTEPKTEAQAFAAGVALELRDERRAAAAALSRLGVSIIDVPAHDLTTSLIDRYLRIKQRGLL
jgi:uncharacterized protein (DUF58 family)